MTIRRLSKGVGMDDILVYALAALREQQEREENEPLTLEELREMDGEPVWLSMH